MNKKLLDFWRKRILFCLIGVLLVIGTNYCLSAPVKAQSVLKVGTEPAFPPFEMQAPNGNKKNMGIC